LHKHSHTCRARGCEREIDTERERELKTHAADNKARLKNCWPVKMGKINCAHVFFFSIVVVVVVYVFLLLFIFLFLFFRYCDLCFCRFFQLLFIHTALPLLLLHVSDFIAICNFRRDALFYFFFLLLLFLLLLVFCHCVMHVARQQLLYIIFYNYILGPFFIFWIFCIFH